MKKSNRQLISVATAGILLLSSYGLAPLQVLATEDIVPMGTENNLLDTTQKAENTTDSIGVQVEENDWEYVTEVIDGVTFSQVTKYTGSQTDVSIPATLGGQRVAINLNNVLRDVLNAKKMVHFEVADTGDKATAVKILDSSFNALFSRQGQITSVDFGNSDTSQVTNMDAMFYECSSLTELNLNYFDTSQVKTMMSMFYGCSGLTELNLDNFNTSQVTDMRSMFNGCSGLTKLNLNHFDTTQVNNMSSMFNRCSGLTELNLDSFDTSQVITMESMFNGCNSLIKLDLSHFDTSQVTDMSSMFYACGSLAELDLSRFNTSQVTNMTAMFAGCSSLTELDLSHFDTSQVSNMNMMFYKCSNLTNLNLGHFDTSQVTGMSVMFRDCSELKQLILPEKFSFGNNTGLRKLSENTKWVQSKEEEKLNVFDTTDDMITAHNQVEAGSYTYTVKQNYTVTFNMNGGNIEATPETQLVLEDELIKEPEDTNAFTKEGYIFDGWDYNGVKYNFDTPVGGNMELVARWISNSSPVQQYQVVFDANKGTGTMNNQTLTWNQEATLTTNTFTREGYTFIGWNTKVDGSGQAYADEETVKNLAESGSVTLYAQWEENQEVVDEKIPLYRVYNPNNGEHFFTTSQEEAHGLINLGWIDEGISWYGEKESNKPAYRLYNPNSGEHFYTLDAREYENVASVGWVKEGISFYTAEDTEIPIYRVFNPNAQNAGSHHYTVSAKESSGLVTEGWKAEGIAFYGK